MVHLLSRQDQFQSCVFIAKCRPFHCASLRSGGQDDVVKHDPITERLGQRKSEREAPYALLADSILSIIRVANSLVFTFVAPCI